MIKITKKKTNKNKHYTTLVIAPQYPHETCWVEGALVMLNTYTTYCKYHILTNENGEAIIGLRVDSVLEGNVFRAINQFNKR